MTEKETAQVRLYKVVQVRTKEDLGREENWCVNPLWVPGACVCLPQVPVKCSLCSSGLLSVKSPSAPFSSFRNPHFYQRMTMSLMQNSNAR